MKTVLNPNTWHMALIGAVMVNLVLTRVLMFALHWTNRLEGEL